MVRLSRFALVALCTSGCFAHQGRPTGQFLRGAESSDEMLGMWRDTLVWPEGKLTFCAIPKVASSSFHKMFNKLNGVSQGKHFKRGASAAKFMDVDWDTVTKANGWTFAMFVRDPLEKYMSAFGHKCVITADHDGSKECAGEAVHVEDKYDEEKVIRAFEARAMSDLRSGLPRNVHWVPQLDQLRTCDEKKFNPGRVDFRGTLNETTTDQIHSMLDMVARGEPQDAVEMYFGTEDNATLGTGSITHNKMERFYRHPKTALAVYHLLKEDYEYFDLPFPSVLKKAMKHANEG